MWDDVKTFVIEHKWWFIGAVGVLVVLAVLF